MEIRLGEVGDLVGIVEIDNHHILNGSATFDDAPVTVADRAGWFGQFDRIGPHRLVVADDPDESHISGYACSIPYRDHPAFAETVEFSIYLAPDHAGRGIGTQLYARLLDELAAERIHRVVVGIALPNDASVALHRRFAFEDVGVFDEYARNAGRYVSSVWMQRRM